MVFDQARPTADEQRASVTPAEEERRFTHIKDRSRSLSDIAVRNEAKEVRPDLRPQARKNRRYIRWNTIRWNTLRIFPGRERRRWLQIVRRSRKVNVGQAPKPHTIIQEHGTHHRIPVMDSAL